MKHLTLITTGSILTLIFILLLKDKHKNQIDYTIKVYKNKATLYDQSNSREVGTCNLDSIGSLIIKDNL